VLSDLQFEELIKSIFELLSKNKASPEDGMEIAQEILLASVERLAKEYGTTAENITRQLKSLQQQPKQQQKYAGVFGNRGWAGNSGGMNEDN